MTTQALPETGPMTKLSRNFTFMPPKEYAVTTDIDALIAWLNSFSPTAVRSQDKQRATEAAAALTALRDERDALRRERDEVWVDDGLPDQLLRDADEMEGCGAGNEANNMRLLVKRFRAFRAAALTDKAGSKPA